MTDPSSSWRCVGPGRGVLGEEWNSVGSVLWASESAWDVEDSAGKEGRDLTQAKLDVLKLRAGRGNGK